MNASDFSYILQWNDRVNGRNLDSISHEDSLVQPPGGNCINWMVGHMVVSRDSILRLCGADPIAPAAMVDRYARGSEPIASDGSAVLPMDQLAEWLKRSSEALEDAFAKVDDATLDSVDEQGRVARSRVQFLLLHDSYHAGQIALARRIAGKPGAIA